MNNKKMIFSFLLIFLLFMSIGGVFSADIDNTTIEEDAINMNEKIDSSTLQRNLSADKLEATSSITTTDYESLTESVKSLNTTNSSITLGGSKVYFISKNITFNNTNAKNLVINGQGRTIYGFDNSSFLCVGANHSVTIKNIIIQNTLADTSSAITNYGNVTMINCTVNFANSTNRAGAIYNNGSFTINNSTFTNCYSPTGGVIYNNNTMTITKSIFTFNIASNAGVILNNGVLKVNSSVFSDNYVTRRGGAIYNSKTITITNSTFKNNEAIVDGGAIYSNNNITIKNSTFSANIANMGGAVYVTSGATCNITISYFNDNYAEEYGGALYTLAKLTNINSTIFKHNNVVVFSGGAIYSGGDILMNNSTLTFNVASLYNGGALYLDSKNSTINNSNFDRNNASIGGAIYIAGNGNVLINSSGFRYNIASESGGALYISNNQTNIMATKFINNTATSYYGGAIYVEQYKVNISKSSFFNNTASSASAIFGTWNSYISATENTFMYNNITSKDGFVVSSFNGNLTFAYNKCTNNTNNKDILLGTPENNTNITVNNNTYTGNLINTTMKVSTSKLTDGEQIRITLTPREIYNTTINNECITLRVNNTIKGSYKVVNNTCNITILNTTPLGVYNATLYFRSATNDFKQISKTILVNHTKNNTKITLAIALSKVDTNLTIKGILVNQNNKAITNANVTIKINKDNNVTVKTLNNGSFTYTYLTKKAGINNISVYYAGSSSYSYCKYNTTFNVLPHTTYVTLYPIQNVKVYNYTYLSGKLFDENKNPVKKVDVILRINNEDYTVHTDNEGMFNFTYKTTIAGDNNFTMIFEGTDNYLAKTHSRNFKVFKRNAYMSLYPIKYVHVGSNTTISGCLFDEVRLAMDNQKVIISINGKNVTVTTNSLGEFKYNYITKTAGNNNLTVIYKATANYNAREASKVFLVL